jgi:hypothetical protein
VAREPLSEFLKGLAQWLDGQDLEHNAKRVRQAMRLIKKLGK